MTAAPGGSQARRPRSRQRSLPWISRSHTGRSDSSGRRPIESCQRRMATSSSVDVSSPCGDLPESRSLCLDKYLGDPWMEAWGTRLPQAALSFGSLPGRAGRSSAQRQPPAATYGAGKPQLPDPPTPSGTIRTGDFRVSSRWSYGRGAPRQQRGQRSTGRSAPWSGDRPGRSAGGRAQTAVSGLRQGALGRRRLPRGRCAHDGAVPTPPCA
jgi:hypothetical protein